MSGSYMPNPLEELLELLKLEKIEENIFRGEKGFEHQAEVPEVPGPEGIPSQVELVRMVQEKPV